MKLNLASASEVAVWQLEGRNSLMLQSDQLNLEGGLVVSVELWVKCIVCKNPYTSGGTWSFYRA